MQWGVNAMTCYMNACRSLGDVETRHLIARMFILLAMDDYQSTIAQVFEKLSANTESRYLCRYTMIRMFIVVQHMGVVDTAAVGLPDTARG